jgi:hypothetical protein
MGVEAKRRITEGKPGKFYLGQVVKGDIIG